MRQTLTASRRNILIAASLGLLVLAISLVIYVGGIWTQPVIGIRTLAETILRNTFNPWNKTLTTYSLNAVSAIIWDYRGIDTLFETTVLLASITGITCLLAVEKSSDRYVGYGMGLIVEFTTRLVVVLTVLIAASTAIHGHLTPGGGFQAGAMLAAAIVLALPSLSLKAIYGYGLTKDVLLLLRYVVLLLIAATAILPVVLIPLTGTAYIMQNQVKEDSVFSMPAWFIDTPLAGSIFIYNLLEALAVAIALSYTVLLMIELVLKGWQ